ncbi:MAG: DnaD domain protein [Clostridia bacterium]|nr:DnaD domain protein [Clostridia bacterium]
MYDSNETLKMIYSDTNIPDIFISEYMPSLNDGQVKVYLFCCYLDKNHKKINELVLSNALRLEVKEASDILFTLIEANLLIKKHAEYHINDIKELEINKLYKPRTVVNQADIGEKREIISSINTKFFQGSMQISWYSTIETLFSLYKFEDSVMYSLFSDCFERGKLKKAYVEQVAKSWSENGVKTHFDLEDYFTRYKSMKDLYVKIEKRLNRKTPLTQYEEKYVEKWLKDYGFSFDIIDIALKNTTKISNPNLEYVHKILTTWHKNGYKTKEEVIHANKQFFENKGKSAENSNVDIKKLYEKVRKQNDAETKKRKTEVYKKITSYKTLDDAITDLSIQALSASGEFKQKLLTSIKEKENEKMALLLEYGFDKDYLTPIYTCHFCRDTGILPNGDTCDCRKEIIKSQ